MHISKGPECVGFGPGVNMWNPVGVEINRHRILYPWQFHLPFIGGFQVLNKRKSSQQQDYQEYRENSEDAFEKSQGQKIN